MKKNSLSLFNQGMSRCQRYVTPETTTTIAQKIFPSGMRVSLAVEVPNASRKADHLQKLKELQSMGLNSRASAFFTGMSTSYAHKLLKK